MNNDFSRILTLLRKERGLSQKEASTGLGISQALLSHYENGKRECGLDFLCTAADYYEVSCDYLLGRSTDRSGGVITINDAPIRIDGDDESDELLKKRTISGSLNIIFRLMKKISDKSVTDDCTMMLMISIYRVLRVLHYTDKSNPKNMFTVAPYNYCALSSGMMSLCEANAVNAAKKQQNDATGQSSVAISPERLSENYPKYAPAMLTLIRMVEENIQTQLGGQ